MFYEEMSFDNFMEALQNFDFGFLNLMLFAAIMLLTFYLVLTAVEKVFYSYKSRKTKRNTSLLESQKLFNEVQS